MNRKPSTIEAYNTLKKRLEACASSPNKDESLCDAANVIREVVDIMDQLSIDELRTLMELYYLIKAHSINPFKIKKP